ncbi:MAG: YfhO family protein [Cyanobacteria bacterium REEB67]|nr:YfhO family protein [Cyanobacteria bacterium REEB67]
MNEIKKSLRSRWQAIGSDWLVPMLFCAGTFAQFWPALSGRISLTKLHQLAEWDSLFAAQHSGQSMLMDPSLVYLMMPYYWLKASLIKTGQVPLWNPYSGLGCPLAADPQALAFSPLHLPLLLSPGLSGYSLVLVLEILILGLSTYGLARSLCLGRSAAAFALFAVAFCPYERWYLELLGNGFCFVPLVFWLILRLRRRPSLLKIWTTGLGCALMLLSAHPELSFFSIALASLALLGIVGADREPRPAPESKRRVVLALLAAGLCSFMLAAPMLVPFLEYLRNSDSYKFGSGAPAVVRWQTWFFDLLQPGFGGASPTLGPAAIVFLPLAFCAAGQKKLLVAVLAALTVICLFITGKIFPFDLLLSRPPLTYLVVNYAFPTVLLLTAILAAFGLDAALATSTGAGKDGSNNSAMRSSDAPPTSISSTALTVSIALALLVAFFPLATRALHLNLTGANFDLCLPDYSFNRNDVLRYSIYAIVTALALIAVKMKPLRNSAIFLSLAALLSASAEITTAAKSMPKRPAFAYSERIVIPELRKNTDGGLERFIATGSHLLRPNTNVVFSLSDLRTHNPLFPRRYLAYIKACGAHLDEFNQTFDSPLSPLLNVAAVGAVLSQEPVTSQAELDKSSQSPYPAQSMTIEPGALTATFSPLAIDAEKQAIFGKLVFNAISQNAAFGNAADLNYNLALYETNSDEVGPVIWFSDVRPLAEDLKKGRFITIPTPITQSGKTVTLAMQVFNKVTDTWLSPDGNHKNTARAKTPFIFGQLKLKEKSTAQIATEQKTKREKEEQGDAIEADADYKLMFESPDHLRIYASQKALPRAFAVRRATFVKSPQEALTAIEAKSFDGRQEVILESSGADIHGDDSVPRAANENGAPPNTAVKIVAFTADKVTLETDLGEPTYVILNDIFYPGWQAKIDGQAARILPANYIMRAVFAPAGKHRIVFVYEPQTFKIGLILSLLAALAGLAIAVRQVLMAIKGNEAE